jgi:DNA topoisomerase-1
MTATEAVMAADETTITECEPDEPVGLIDPVASADAAGLHYLTDVGTPGIRRRRAGRGVAYRGPDGQPVRDPATLARIRSLAVPPAWTEVWISPDPDGHLQATGRDARGRKQYRYHPRWREVRDALKYDRLVSFATALPAIRARVEADLRRPGLPRERVLATVVRLLEETHIRIGNDEYRRQNDSFGLTTLRDEHAAVADSALRFTFRGKSGKDHTVTLRNGRLARIVRRCQELPGQQLFQYRDDEGQPRAIGSADVNDYLRTISGGDFTAKDFRTWGGTVLAAHALRRLPPAETERERRQQVVQVIKEVADRLGNTPTVCRKCYIHPAIIDAFEHEALPPAEREQPPLRPAAAELSPDEQVVLDTIVAAAR